MKRYILIIKCPDRKGIVAAVSNFLLAQRASITELTQCDEDETFFMRVSFEAADDEMPSLTAIGTSFSVIAIQFGMWWEIFDSAVRPRVMVAVSRFGHCLYDLLHRARSNLLSADIIGVVSNHDDMRSFVDWNGIPYFHFPVEKGKKEEQEKRILALISEYNIDLLVLARYMQVLSPSMCAALQGRCINIHHSFLPSFKGAKPYHQAHARGVKIIGATAHYVTTDLDEGPIIEQGTHRVNHSFSPEKLVETGRSVECYVLARAVRWHAEHRIIMNGTRTIIFE